MYIPALILPLRLTQSSVHIFHFFFVDGISTHILGTHDLRNYVCIHKYMHTHTRNMIHTRRIYMYMYVPSFRQERPTYYGLIMLNFLHNLYV